MLRLTPYVDSKRFNYLDPVILALGIGSADPAFTEPSKSDATGDSNEIWLGMSTALTGPAEDLGLDMRAGILAAFEESHQNGGVHGLRPRHHSLDDGYEPDQTVPNMRQLVENSKVLGITGSVVLRERPDVVLLDLEMPGTHGGQGRRFTPR